MSKIKITLIVAVIVLILSGTAYLLINQPGDNVYDMQTDESEMLNQDQESDMSEVTMPDNNPGDVSFLYGKTWVWTKTQMNDDSQTLPKQAGKFSLTFNQDGSINGTTDCNSFFGNVSFSEDGFMTFGPIGSTKMFCEDSQEAEFIKMVTDSNRVWLAESGELALLLPYDSGSVIFSSK